MRWKLFTVLCLVFLSRSLRADVGCVPAVQTIVPDEFPTNRFPQLGRNVDIDGEFAVFCGARTGAWVFQLVGSRWEEVTHLRPAVDSGRSCSIRGDLVAVGTLGAATAWVYRRDEDANWGLEGELIPWGEPVGPGTFGHNVVIGDGFIAVSSWDEWISGVERAGAVYVYREEDGAWVPERKLVELHPVFVGIFGWRLDADGNRIVVSAPGGPNTVSRAYVYLRRGQDDWDLEGELEPPEGLDEFGFASTVAIHGEWVSVSSERNSDLLDRTVMYRLDNGEWTHVQTIPGINHTRIDGAWMVGTRIDSTGQSDGPVSLWTVADGSWVETARLESPSTSAEDAFGTGIATSGDWTIIGDPRDDTWARLGGRVYVWRTAASPSPAISPTASDAMTGEELQFDASESTAPEGAEISSYLWDLGDGTEKSGVQVRHTYAAPGRYRIILAVEDSQGGCAEAEVVATVRCPSSAPPWSAADIGEPPFPGSASFSGDGDTRCLEVCAAGRDIDGSEDQFHFVFQEMSGDLDVVARVADILPSAAAFEKTGWMVRESLEAGSRHVSMFARAGTGIFVPPAFRFSHRDASDGPTQSIEVGTPAFPNAWIRLRRAGDDLIGEYSEDGETWTLAGQVTMDLPRAVLVGIAATGRIPNPEREPRAIQATLCDVKVGVETSFVRGDVNADESIDLSDGVSVFSFLFLSRGAPTCRKSADTNDDGAVDISDGIYVLGYLFTGGPEPPAPFPDCGADEMPDDLDCESFAPCF